MKTRVISGVVLVILALAVILTGGYFLAAVLLFLALTAYRELMKACKLADSEKKFSALEIVGYVGIIAYYLLIVYVFTFPKYNAQQIMCSFFCVAYAPVMLSFVYLVRDLEYGIYLVWMIFISSWVCDTCAYFSGVLLGRHKLAPVLSPKKSIEGAVGGVLGSMIVGALYAYFIVESVISNQQILWIFVLISGVGAVVSQVGDLAASAIKRNHEIKDYGKLIPGHGGVMDRFDSVIFTAPMIYSLAFLLIHG